MDIPILCTFSFLLCTSPGPFPLLSVRQNADDDLVSTKVLDHCAASHGDRPSDIHDTGFDAHVALPEEEDAREGGHEGALNPPPLHTKSPAN